VTCVSSWNCMPECLVLVCMIHHVTIFMTKTEPKHQMSGSCLHDLSCNDFHDKESTETPYPMPLRFTYFIVDRYASSLPYGSDII
jgi:hypothetical protein